MADRANGKRYRGNRAGFTVIDGSSALRPEYVRPERVPYKERRRRAGQRLLRNEERKNRLRAHLVQKPDIVSIFHAIVIVCAIMAVAAICASHLRYQTEIAARTHEISALQSELNSLKAANDEEYARIMGSVDLEKIKKVAMDELGMTYPDEAQIVTFSDDDGDYVRQYGDIPGALSKR